MISKRIAKDIEEEIIPEFEKELSTLQGKTILITGGNGFLPSYLVDTFNTMNKVLKKPIKMLLVNKNPITDSSRLSHLRNNPNVKFLTQDVGEDFEITEKPSIIMHAASRANPSSFLADPIDTINANVNGMRTLLEYARKNPVEEFIFFSSGENYGNPLSAFIPTPETYPGNVDPLNRHSCYIESKRFCESYAMAYYRQYNVPVKLLRIMLAYGPGIRDDGKVVSDFFNAAIADRKITIRDRGEAKRSFSYASDAARAIFRVMFHGTAGEAYNIGDDTNNVTIKSLASLIAQTLGEDIEVLPNMNAPQKEIYGEDNRFLDITKIRKLGFEPKVSLEEGLKRLKEHYQETGKILTVT